MWRLESSCDNHHCSSETVRAVKSSNDHISEFFVKYDINCRSLELFTWMMMVSSVKKKWEVSLRTWVVNNLSISCENSKWVIENFFQVDTVWVIGQLNFNCIYNLVLFLRVLISHWKTKSSCLVVRIQAQHSSNWILMVMERYVPQCFQSSLS